MVRKNSKRFEKQGLMGINTGTLILPTWEIDWLIEKPQPTPPLLIFGNFNTLGNSHRPTRITCTMLNWYCVFRRDCLDLFGFFQMCKEMTSFCLFCFREGVYFLQIHENLTDWAPIAPNQPTNFSKPSPFWWCLGCFPRCLFLHWNMHQNLSTVTPIHLTYLWPHTTAWLIGILRMTQL